MTRLTWVAAIVLLAAALVWLVGAPDRRDATPAGQSALDDEPDLYMEDTTISQFNDDGTLRYKLVAAVEQHAVPPAPAGGTQNRDYTTLQNRSKAAPLMSPSS